MNKEQTIKADGGKLRPSLFPWLSINPVLRVLEFGANKYRAHSWRDVEPERYVEALLRHVVEWGERHRTEGVLCTDEESGLPTLAHIACNALFLLAHPKVSLVKDAAPEYRLLCVGEYAQPGDEYKHIFTGNWLQSSGAYKINHDHVPHRRRIQ